MRLIDGDGWRTQRWVHGVYLRLSVGEGAVGRDFEYREAIVLAAALVAHLRNVHAETIENVLDDIQRIAHQFEDPTWSK